MLGSKIGNIFGLRFAGMMASSLGSLMTGAFSALMQASKWLVIAAAVGAVAQGVAALGVALAQLAGLAPLAVPAVLALVSVFGALKVAVSGFGDALKQAWAGGDITKLNAAMAKLAPSAQATVLALVKLKPALDTFKKSVQESFFKGFATDIQVLAAVYLPLLQTHLSGVATIFNRLVGDLTKFFTAKDVVNDWAKTFGSIRTIISNITSGLVFVVDAFRHIGVVAAPILAQLTSGFGGWAKRFDDLMATFQSTGAMAAFINQAITTFGKLLELLGNIYEIIRPIFAVFTGANDRILNQLIRMTQQFADFLSSAQATEFIVSLLDTLNQVLISLGPGVMALFKGIGQAVVALEPALTALGGALGAALIALAPALSIAADAIASILTDLAPIIPIVAKFVATFVEDAAPVLEMLAPLITIAFQTLSDVLTPLLPTIQTIAEYLVEFIGNFADAAGDFLKGVLPDLAHLLVSLGPILEQILPLLFELVNELLLPLIPVAQKLLQAFLPLVEILGQALGDALIRIIPPLDDLITALVDALMPIFPALMPLIIVLVGILADLIMGLMVQAGPIIEQFLIPFILMVGQILPQLIPLIIALSQTLLDLLPLAGPILLLFMKLAIMWMPLLIAILPDLIGALTWLVTTMDAFIGPTSQVLGGLISLTNAFLNLHNWIVVARIGWEEFKNGLVSEIKDWWKDHVTQPLDDMKKVFDGIVKFFKDAPTTIKNAIGDLGGLLVNEGQNIVRGLVNGITSMATWLKNSVSNFIKNNIPAVVRNLLGISSPSRVMAELGQWIPAGLAQGMDAGSGSVVSAATRLAAAALPAYAGSGSMGGGSSFGPGMGTGAGGDTYWIVDLGDGIRQVVKATLTDQSATVAAGSDEGRRQRKFLSPGRGTL